MFAFMSFRSLLLTENSFMTDVSFTFGFLRCCWQLRHWFFLLLLLCVSIIISVRFIWWGLWISFFFNLTAFLRVLLLERINLVPYKRWKIFLLEVNCLIWKGQFFNQTCFRAVYSWKRGKWQYSNLCELNRKFSKV